MIALADAMIALADRYRQLAVIAEHSAHLAALEAMCEYDPTRIEHMKEVRIKHVRLMRQMDPPMSWAEICRITGVSTSYARRVGANTDPSDDLELLEST